MSLRHTVMGTKGGVTVGAEAEHAARDGVGVAGEVGLVVPSLLGALANINVAGAARAFAVDGCTFERAMIGQSLLGLRRLQRELISSVKLSEPKDLPSLAGAICKIIEQRRILLRIPGPPTGGATKTATPAPINAQILDAEPIEHVSSRESTPGR
jgi:hypothetical protein